MPRRLSSSGRAAQTEVYTHSQEALLRPEIGTQSQFKKRKAPRRFHYDSSLSPALDWDEQNPVRELGEWLLQQVHDASELPAPHAFETPRRFGNVTIAGLPDAVAALKGLSAPLLNWAGRAERTSFEVPTVPLFVHERLSTKAILETLRAHERDRQMELQLFGDPQLSLAQQLEAYEHVGGWVNRLILGDSLVVMNSLLEYEGLGGHVQMIYIDPPYGVSFDSNFQPFVRRREVKDGSDNDMTREPEMVKAYRDTWELGIHSYLTYLRDRLLLARELLAQSGSVFVQISDDNLHHVREVMDEILGPENFCAEIAFAKTSGRAPRLLSQVSDYLIWYARDRQQVKFHPLFEPRPPIDNPYERYICVETSDGQIIDLSVAQKLGNERIPEGRLLRLQQATSQGENTADRDAPVEYEGRPFYPPPGRHWSVTATGMQSVVEKGRAYAVGNTLTWKSYRDEFPFRLISDNWNAGIGATGFGASYLYVVQTNPTVVQRCVLMTTDPGDLVLDPTCGSGTTAYVAEQWGRRWITMDTSRVPLALTRQRLLTATFSYYQLHDPTRGPASGFVYERRQSRDKAEIGGIVPHTTLKSIAYDEPAPEEVLVDRPQVRSRVTRVAGPFCVEATIPTPLNGEDASDTEAISDGSFGDRMLEVLRRNPSLQLGANRTVTLRNIRVPTKSLTISAEAELDETAGAVALVFGPENGAISERFVYEGAREAHARTYDRLIVIGFAIEASARELVERCEALMGIPATYVQATPDLVMGDLLKTMRSSQIFSVTGLPDVGIKRLRPEEPGGTDRYQVELRGLDVFDPTTMGVEHRGATDVPAWLLDTDYNDLCFLVSQAFFPRTSAWESLKAALRGEYDDSVWEHLAGTTSAPFTAGERRKVAVKVIDDRGNELLVVKSLDTNE